MGIYKMSLDHPWKSYKRERLSTVDLLVLPSLRSNPFGIENIFPLIYKTSYLNEEVNCTEPSPHLVFPGPSYDHSLGMGLRVLKIIRGYLMGESLDVIWAEFSTLSLVHIALLNNKHIQPPLELKTRPRFRPVS
jgi:hypothetical protein